MSTPAGPLAGRLVGAYRLEELVGCGGMGAVYRANREAGGSAVALKLLLRHDVDSEDWLVEARRLRDEASAASKLRHPHLVRIINAGEDAVLGPFVVYEYLDKGTLRDWIRKHGRLPFDEAYILVGRPMLSALSALHRAGIVHRDVKPDNLFRGPDGTFKVGDLGLAVFEGREARTKTGILVGTPGYIAPERFTRPDRPPTAADDCYAAAVLLVEAVTGKVPFLGNTPQTVLRQQLTADVKPSDLVEGGIPRPAAVVLCTALERDPEVRVSDAAHLLADLEAAVATARETETTVTVAAGPELPADTDPGGFPSSTMLACVLALVAIVAVALWSHHESPGPVTPPGPVPVPTRGSTSQVATTLIAGLEKNRNTARKAAPTEVPGLIEKETHLLFQILKTTRQGRQQRLEESLSFLRGLGRKAWNCPAGQAHRIQVHLAHALNLARGKSLPYLELRAEFLDTIARVPAVPPRLRPGVEKGFTRLVAALDERSDILSPSLSQWLSAWRPRGPSPSDSRKTFDEIVLSVHGTGTELLESAIAAKHRWDDLVVSAFTSIQVDEAGHEARGRECLRLQARAYWTLAATVFSPPVHLGHRATFMKAALEIVDLGSQSKPLVRFYSRPTWWGPHCNPKLCSAQVIEELKEVGSLLGNGSSPATPPWVVREVLRTFTYLWLNRAAKYRKALLADWHGAAGLGVPRGDPVESVLEVGYLYEAGSLADALTESDRACNVIKERLLASYDQTSSPDRTSIWESLRHVSGLRWRILRMTGKDHVAAGEAEQIQKLVETREPDGARTVSSLRLLWATAVLTRAHGAVKSERPEAIQAVRPSLEVLIDDETVEMRHIKPLAKRLAKGRPLKQDDLK